MIANRNVFQSMGISGLISLKPHRNYKATIYALVVFALYVAVYSIMIKYSFKSSSIPTYNDIDIFQILVISLWLLIVVSIVWSYKIAKQTGREPAIWVMIGIFTGLIGLLIIELNKLKDTEIENWNPEWITNENICPACGTRIDKKSNNCLNCGLRIK